MSGAIETIEIEALVAVTGGHGPNRGPGFLTGDPVVIPRHGPRNAPQRCPNCVGTSADDDR
jgi:hypothetical protein